MLPVDPVVYTVLRAFLTVGNLVKLYCVPSTLLVLRALMMVGKVVEAESAE